jgi:hypothetical protein
MTLKYVINDKAPFHIHIYDNDVLIMDQPFYPSGEMFATFEEAKFWAQTQIEHITNPIVNPAPPISPNADLVFAKPLVFEGDVEINNDRELVDTNGIDTTSDYLEQTGFLQP